MYTVVWILSLMPLLSDEPPSPPQPVPAETKIWKERQLPAGAKFGRGVKLITGASAGQLQRPSPVCRLNDVDVKAATTRLLQVLKHQGITITKIDALEGEVHGTLAIDKDTEVRLLLWLERELTSCAGGFKGFMTTAVFTKVMGYDQLVPVEMTQVARQRLVLLSSALIETSLRESE